MLSADDIRSQLQGSGLDGHMVEQAVELYERREDKADVIEVRGSVDEDGKLLLVMAVRKYREKREPEGYHPALLGALKAWEEADRKLGLGGGVW